jgi:hypothetical protein
MNPIAPGRGHGRNVRFLDEITVESAGEDGQQALERWVCAERVPVLGKG